MICSECVLSQAPLFPGIVLSATMTGSAEQRRSHPVAARLPHMDPSRLSGAWPEITCRLLRPSSPSAPTQCEPLRGIIFCSGAYSGANLLCLHIY